MAPDFRTGPRWADMRDSSNESFPQQSNSAAPVMDTLDSYRDPPDRSDKELGDNSQATLNLRFRQSGTAASSGHPRDFAFLLGSGRSEGAAAAPTLSAGCYARQLRTSISREDPSTDCPDSQESLGVSEPAQSNLSRSMRRAALPVPRDVLSSGVDGGPSDFSFLLDVAKRQEPLLEEEGSLGSDGELGLLPSAAPTSRRRNNRKRRQGAGQAGCAKKPREGGHTTAEEVAAQDVDGSAAADVEIADGEGDVMNAVDTADGGLQPCDEESMLHRLEKRATLIEIIKRSPEYGVLCKTRPSSDRELDDGGTPAPKTPDASDRNISKRRWEEDVRHWRLALRQWEVKNAS